MKRILSLFLTLVLTAALLFGVVCIMAAGIGALGEQMLGLPVWLGAAIACVLIAAAAYFGLGGMVSVFTVAVPCMIVAALVIAGIRLHRAGLTAAAFAAGSPSSIESLFQLPDSSTWEA